MSRTSTKRSLARPIVAIAVATSAVAASAPGAFAQIAANPEPSLRLVTAANSITVERYVDDEGGVYVDQFVGTYLVANSKTPFEVRVSRKSYKDPIVAQQRIRANGKDSWKTLPTGIVNQWEGFQDFARTTLTNSAGVKVGDSKQPFCPNGNEYSGSRTMRYLPSAPDTSPYFEYGCPWNPFTLGSLWGIQKGWATGVAALDESVYDLEKVPDGAYTVKVGVDKKYRDALGIAGSDATVKIAIKTIKEEPHGPHGLKKRAQGVNPKPAAKEPTGVGAVPKVGPRPDLRSLPAWSISAQGDDPETPAKETDTLSFAANVWNAGPSPLVVDGFRRPNEDLMDAYQYFYDLNGRQVGYKKTGTMEWDARDGHLHWHFRDFAQYTLLKENQTDAVRSHKESFCLAPTDAIDLLVKGANFKPGNRDLHTACGGKSALSIREVLDTGHGDTYYQYVAGQSFDIHNLPNGTYYVKVEANPTKNLYESNLKNNVSLRKVILGGKPGARTVQVPPYEGIDTEGPIG